MVRLFAILVAVGLISWAVVTALYSNKQAVTDSSTPPSLSDLTFSSAQQNIINSSTATAPAAQPATSASTFNPYMSTPPAMTIDQSKQYNAVLHTTYGDITIALNKGQTPITVNNFVNLAEAHFYDNTIFHRVIKGFMIQGGDPNGTGSGGPGYRFDDEQFTGDYTRGTVAMANAGPNTNGSQFFIMHADVPLEHHYVIFGHVTEGMDVVDKIASAKVTVANGEQSRPVDPVVVKSVDIKAE